MLAGRTDHTAPYGWLGKHDTLHDYVTGTFTRLGGSGLKGDDFDALVSYVGAMPSPNLQDQPPLDAKEQKLVERGRDLFFAERQGCSGCHVGGQGVDTIKHDVGSHALADIDKQFDTPSLHFVAGTAPYFHDGRYATLDALLTSTDNQMGHTMNLSQRDVAALKAYLETL
jgi:cytochrome c peroxidase